MRRKKSIPLPDPNMQGFEYSCPSASWDGVTELTPPADESVDMVDKARNEFFHSHHEYRGDGKKADKQP